MYTLFTILLHTLYCLKWSDRASNVTVQDFSETVGPTSYIPSDPFQCFQLFFDDAIIDAIVTETNTYAQQVLTSQSSPTHWSTNAEEIKAYFGISILMGINCLLELRDYWSTDPCMHYALIAHIIGRDRFEEITRFLHFTKNEDLPARGDPEYTAEPRRWIQFLSGWKPTAWRSSIQGETWTWRRPWFRSKRNPPRSNICLRSPWNRASRYGSMVAEASSIIFWTSTCTLVVQVGAQSKVLLLT